MDNSGKEKEAMQLMAEADKKVKSSGSFLGGMFGWDSNDAGHDLTFKDIQWPAVFSNSICLDNEISLLYVHFIP